MESFTWEIVEMGRRYRTVGVRHGEWELDSGSKYYTLHPVGSCRGVEISGEHGLYYAIDIATAFIEKKVLA